MLKYLTAFLPIFNFSILPQRKSSSKSGAIASTDSFTIVPIDFSRCFPFISQHGKSIRHHKNPQTPHKSAPDIIADGLVR